MQPISGLAPGTAQSPATVGGVKEVPKVQRPESEEQGRSLKPVMDKYIPEEKQEPSGRYWLGRDEDGHPKIYFDDPEQAADAPKKPKEAPAAEGPGRNQEAKGPEKSGKQEERCVGDTGKVDREIERLKKKQQELEQRLGTETDEAKIRDLKRQLAQVERELRQKDSDTYRKQHTTFTRLS